MRSEDVKDLERPLPTGAPRAGRKPWNRPRIVDRQSIEAMAADCGVAGGKSDPTCLVPFS